MGLRILILSLLFLQACVPILPSRELCHWPFYHNDCTPSNYSPCGDFMGKPCLFNSTPSWERNKNGPESSDRMKAMSKCVSECNKEYYYQDVEKQMCIKKCESIK
jgi:hypothetical protein